jgi:TRAP-type C4-dicarboxylate transport system substrate-binding protein
VVKGVVDIGMSAFGYTGGRFPVMATLDLPNGYCSGAHAAKVSMEFYKRIGPKEVSDVKLLYVTGHSPGCLHTKKPVRNLSDLKGMKIRCYAATAKIVKALGGLPVAMPQTETYQALKKGIVEGNITPYEPLKSMHQAKAIRYTTETPAIAYTGSFFIAMNLDKWNALPEDIKEIFDTVSEEWAVIHGKTWDRYDKVARAYTLSLGNEIIKLPEEETSRWRQALEPLFENHVKYLESKGLPGREILSTAKALVKEYAKFYCK